MPTPESALKTKFKVAIKNFSSKAWILVPQDVARAGIPDVLIMNMGRFYAVELKIGKAQPTVVQEVELKKIAIAGGCAHVVRAKSDLYILEYWSEFGFYGKEESFANVPSLVHKMFGY